MTEVELAELRAWLAGRGRAIESLEVPRERLDRIFLERVGRSERRREEGA
jgi:hypothetical protein